MLFVCVCLCVCVCVFVCVCVCVFCINLHVKFTMYCILVCYHYLLMEVCFVVLLG